jgi:hypothetical protein
LQQTPPSPDGGFWLELGAGADLMSLPVIKFLNYSLPLQSSLLQV